MTTPTVSIAAPSPATGALTRYVVGFRVSATGGMSGEAGSTSPSTCPPAPARPAGRAARCATSRARTDVGSCPQPTAGRSRCTFFSVRVRQPGRRAPGRSCAGSRTAAWATRTVAVDHQLRPPADPSGPFTITAVGTLAELTVRAETLTPQATTRYLVRMRVSGTGGLSGEAGSRSGSRSRRGPRSPASSPGSVTDTTRAVVVGFCGTPVGARVDVRVLLRGLREPRRRAARSRFPATHQPAPPPGRCGASTTLRHAPTVPAPSRAVRDRTAATVADADADAHGGADRHADGDRDHRSPTRGPDRRRRPPRRRRRRRTASYAAPSGSSSRARTPYVELDPGRGHPARLDRRHQEGRRDDPTPGGEAEFYDGIFKLTPVRRRDRPDAGRAARAAASRKARRGPPPRRSKTRKLWGEGKGAFRTSGKYSAATVRGTTWLVQDSCTGTLTRVTEGVVDGARQRQEEDRRRARREELHG